MADRIKVRSEWLDSCASDLKAIENAIRSAQETLSNISLSRSEGGDLNVRLNLGLALTNVRFTGGNPREDIQALSRAAQALGARVSQLSTGASRAAQVFEMTEDYATQLLRNITYGKETDVYENESIGGDDYGIPNHISFSDLGFSSPFIIGGLSGLRAGQSGGAETFKLFGIPMGVSGAVISGTASHSSKIGMLDVNQTIEGELFGYSTKSYNGKWEVKKKDGKISSGAKIGAEGEVHLAQGKYNRDINGLLHREISGTVGQVSAEGTAGVSLYKDGKFSPALEAKLKAEAVALKGSFEDRIGTEDYNYHKKASGSLGVANAEANAGIGRITYKDENGVQHTEWGAQGKVGAEAYLAEGKVTGGYTIMGIKIDAGVSGKFGGAGASAGGQVTTSGMSGNVDLGFGAGVGLNVSVDWSGFKPPQLPKIKLPELKMPSFKLW